MEIKLTPKDQKEFNHVAFAARNKDVEGTFPDFLIVGPQRTGTTWLSKNLRFHPELCISIPKELYYFSRLGNREQGSLHFHNFIKRLRKEEFYAQPKIFRELLKVLYFDLLVTGNYKANQLEWYMKFFKMDSFIYWRHFAKMKKLTGKPYRPKMIGESTASYAILDEGVIDEIVRLNPDIKIILMVRNPIDRAWSHAVKDLARNRRRQVGSIEPEAFIDFLKKPNLENCGYYSKQIYRWKKYVNPGNLYIGKYSDVSEKPTDLLKNIFAFLEVEQDEKYIGEHVKKVVNPTTKSEIPSKVKKYLVDTFQDEMTLLNNQYGFKF